MAFLRTFMLGIVPILALLTWQYVNQIQNTIFGNERNNIPIVMAGITHYSHLEKILPFANMLTELGYPVTFTTGAVFSEMVGKTGAAFEPIEGPADILAPEEWQEHATLAGIEADAYLPVCAFIKRIPGQQRTVQQLLSKLKSQYGSVVYLHDQAFFGHLPVLLGGDGIKPTVSISFGLAPLPFESNDTYPFPALQPPDTTVDATKIHQQAYLEVDQKDPLVELQNSALRETLEELKVPLPHPRMFTAMGSFDEYHLQLGIPEFEYVRSDLPTEVRYLGIPSKVGGDRQLPPWWPEMLEAKQAGKKIVVVSQGSAFPDLRDLIIPTLEALKDRDDLFVIATTVVMEPEDVDGLIVPSNARASRFVPFDVLLPEASLLVAAGGYGTIIQSIAAGVPMILAGMQADKGHNGVLGEYTNIAINMATATPGVDKIRKAVVEILGSHDQPGNKKYLENVRRMQNIAKQYDPIKIMDATILEAIQNGKK